jgi:hypothetical protein
VNVAVVSDGFSKEKKIIRDEDSRPMHGAVTNQNPLGGDQLPLCMTLPSCRATHMGVVGA